MPETGPLSSVGGDGVANRVTTKQPPHPHFQLENRFRSTASSTDAASGTMSLSATPATTTMLYLAKGKEVSKYTGAGQVHAKVLTTQETFGLGQRTACDLLCRSSHRRRKRKRESRKGSIRSTTTTQLHFTRRGCGIGQSGLGFQILTPPFSVSTSRRRRGPSGRRRRLFAPRLSIFTHLQRIYFFSVSTSWSLARFRAN